MKTKFAVLLFVIAAAFTVYGCAKQADTSKPVEQIKQEVQAMSVSDLESNAKAYVNAITARQSDLEKIGAQLKTLSPTEIFGDKAKGIKEQLSKIQSDVSALTERYQVYAQKYQAAGGDISKIKIG